MESESGGLSDYRKMRFARSLYRTQSFCNDWNVTRVSQDEEKFESLREFKNHVREPAKRDLAMVAKGDITRVKRSYNGFEGKLNKDVHRISN